MTKMGMKYKVKLLLGMLLMSGLSLAEPLPFSETGKYCETPARCLNPITTQIMVTSPNYLATQAGLDVLQQGSNAGDADNHRLMSATAPRGDGLAAGY